MSETRPVHGKSDDVVLEPEVLRIVEMFRDRYGDAINDAAFVRERCAELSEEFAEACRKRSVPAQTITGGRFGEDTRSPGVVLLLAGHYATVVPRSWDEGQQDWVGELVVDWTAHQFTDPAIAVTETVPWVVTVEHWRTIWKNPATAT